MIGRRAGLSTRKLQEITADRQNDAGGREGPRPAPLRPRCRPRRAPSRRRHRPHRHPRPCPRRWRHPLHAPPLFRSCGVILQVAIEQSRPSASRTRERPCPSPACRTRIRRWC